LAGVSEIVKVLGRSRLRAKDGTAEAALQQDSSPLLRHTDEQRLQRNANT